MAIGLGGGGKGVVQKALPRTALTNHRLDEITGSNMRAPVSHDVHNDVIIFHW